MGYFNRCIITLNFLFYFFIFSSCNSLILFHFFLNKLTILEKKIYFRYSFFLSKVASLIKGMVCVYCSIFWNFSNLDVYILMGKYLQYIFISNSIEYFHKNLIQFGGCMLLLMGITLPRSKGNDIDLFYQWKYGTSPCYRC